MAVNSGVLGLVVGGVEFGTAETAKYSIDNTEVESVVGGSGRLGRSTKGKACFIEVEVFFDETQESGDVKVTGETVVLRCRDRLITLESADHVGSTEVDAAKNSATVRFESRRGMEQLV